MVQQNLVAGIDVPPYPNYTTPWFTITQLKALAEVYPDLAECSPKLGGPEIYSYTQVEV